MNKIGLLDFWYYDDQEFYFLDGRMLLRGSNGSGKSVTMQSFIPLLLDGNMRPERLDPFGSRARKMENYLLEDGDGRDERTGYLYMEFKRKDVENFLTIGIGLRARRGKKLDPWYFCITDGRRIGKDIFLYKDLKEKIAYSKIELRNRIGDGGRIFESQKEYAAYVNQVLFGFETMDEYREMLELLIQLRTPKLSKDFKPTVINDILGNSLQTLSEDDLRPMSEAIENMDGLKTNLDNLKESLEAAKQIEKVYDQYNQIVLYHKAAKYKKETAQYNKIKDQLKTLEATIKETKEKYEQELQHHEELTTEQSARQEERRSLEHNDATKLKEQEQVLTKQITDLEQKIEEKQRQLEQKREKQIQNDDRLKRLQDEKEQSKEEIKDIFDEMEECISEAAFDEFDFMKDEFEKSEDEGFDFYAHRQILERYQQKIQDGIDVLEKERKAQDQYDEYLKKLDEFRAQRESAEREYHQYENQFQEIKEELTEKVYHWEKDTKLLKLEDEQLQAISRMIKGYMFGTDEGKIYEIIRHQKYIKEDQLRDQQRILTAHKEDVETQLKEKRAQLEEWQNQKDPEPQLSEEVYKNRELLKEYQVEAIPFYKAIDFADRLNDEQRNRLEEALYRMGVLNALIVEEEDRSRIESLDQGTCDTYIYGSVEHVKNNMLELLNIDNEENDILFYQKISNVLSSIGYISSNEKEVSTWIRENGNFKIGILEGTITGNYQAKYIGAMSRERYRKEQERLLEEICENLQHELDVKQEEIRQNEEQITLLHKEEEIFPEFQDLKIAAKEFDQKEHILSMVEHQVKEQQEVVETSAKSLNAIHLEVQTICSGIYLAVRFDVFMKVKENLAEYQKLLMKLQLEHQTYLNRLSDIKGKQEYAQDIEVDIDEILYDQGQAERQCREIKVQRDLVIDQLSLTDYEEIKHQLDQCLERIAKLPAEIERSIVRSTSLRKDLERFKQDLEIKNIDQEQQAIIVGFLKDAFCMELKQGLVDLDLKADIQTEEGIRQLSNMICKTYRDVAERRTQNDAFALIQENFQRNKVYLHEYFPTIHTMFDDISVPESLGEFQINRINITGKYRGVTIEFKKLVERLNVDVEEQARLLSDRDRELFEDILANTLSKKIRAKIQSSKRWVDNMNQLMESMQTSSGLKLSLKWKSKKAGKEEQLDTRKLVDILQKDYDIMREEEVLQLSQHFRSKIDEARKMSGESDGVQSFHSIMKDVLDYRKWFEFQLEYQKTGEKKRELTDRTFFTFSGGEKAMAMYVPLFSAVAAKYEGAREDAPRMISLDEAFAGVDEMNIKDMFRLMVEFEFDFMMNSQILWGDYETVPVIAVYQLIRPENVKYVTVISYVWNGKVRSLVDKIGDEIERG